LNSAIAFCASLAELICPQCGGIVNAQLSSPPCNDAKHAASRRQRSAFCVDCGVQLIIVR